MLQCLHVLQDGELGTFCAPDVAFDPPHFGETAVLTARQRRLPGTLIDRRRLQPFQQHRVDDLLNGMRQDAELHHTMFLALQHVLVHFVIAVPDGVQSAMWMIRQRVREDQSAISGRGYLSLGTVMADDRSIRLISRIGIAIEVNGRERVESDHKQVFIDNRLVIVETYNRTAMHPMPDIDHIRE